MQLSSFRLSRQWACINCGKLIWTEIPFCYICFPYLETRMHQAPSRKILDISVLALFEWNPKESDSLSNLILYLKKQPVPAWRIWAKFFALSYTGPLQNSVLIPCPGRSAPRTHSLEWANALGAELEIPVCDCLEYISNSHVENKRQKTFRGRLENSQMQIKTEFATNLTSKSLIFIDDIVTTGATFTQAIGAVKPYLFSQAWVFASRAKLAPFG